VEICVACKYSWPDSSKLGRLSCQYHAQGSGVPTDRVIAYMWVNIAGANGLDVDKFMESSTQVLSQADISKAQELTRQYVKDHPRRCNFQFLYDGIKGVINGPKKS